MHMTVRSNKISGDLLILGFSPATVSMLLDCVLNLKSPDPGVQVKIVQNMPVTAEIAFESPGIETDLVQSSNFKFTELHQCILGVYRTKVKKEVLAYFHGNLDSAGSTFVNLIHPDTSIASTVKLGHGVFINPQSTLAPYAVIGDHVTINRNTSIGHHTKLASLVTVNPGVNIAGHCHIGTGATIGMGANIVDGVKIGEFAVIGAGALVTKDIPAHTTAYGVPAKIISKA